MLETTLNVLIVLAILVGLVLAHELGHFVMARRAGVVVHEFGIGFPPRAAVLYRGSETVYSLNWLPIGGFLRLEGEEGESFEPRSFVNQRLGTRTRILLAGVVVNFALAWIVFALIALLADPVYQVRIGSVADGSPAALVGLGGGKVVETAGTDEAAVADGRVTYDDSGDLITAIDGRRFAVFDDIDPPSSRESILRYLDDHAGDTVILTVQRPGGSIEDVVVTLKSPSEIAQQPGALGIDARVGRTETMNGLADAAAIGLRRTVQASTLILRGVGELVGSFVPGTQSGVSAAGPVGMVDIVGEARSFSSPVYLFWLVGLLSANLAVINALPLPPMDGGRVFMVLLRALSRGRVGLVAERAMSLTGFIVLMVVLGWVTLADIQRLTG